MALRLAGLLAALGAGPAYAEPALKVIGCAEQRGLAFSDESGFQSDQNYILLREKEVSKEFFRIYADPAASKTTPWPATGPVTAAIVSQRTFDWINSLPRPFVVEARRSTSTTIIVRMATADEKCS